MSIILVFCAVGKSFLPVFFSLLPDKTYSSYKILFNQCLKFCGCPETVLMDFELGSIKALKEIFPEATLRGCLFHWQHNIINQVIFKTVNSMPLLSFLLILDKQKKLQTST